MQYHIIAFFTGFLLDMLLGDPCWLPHPVRLMGGLITWLEKHLPGHPKEKAQETLIFEDSLERTSKGKKYEKKEKREFRGGIWLVVLVSGVTLALTAFILFGAYYIHSCAGMLVEMVMTYQILAAKCLKVESMKVYRCLKNQGLEEARKAVAMIVGRDTQFLTEEGVAKAAIETVAENTADGVIAPMLYTALGGPLLGFWYKAVNTMDSMVGYKNDKYLFFGRAAAKLDDAVNFFPSRISACLMLLAAFVGEKCFAGEFSGKRAVFIYKRDNRKHASPNSAQTESVCAGALGIQLAGDASYFGKMVKKPLIGDSLRKVEAEDIRRANQLMYLTAWIGELVCLLLMIGLLQICV